MDRLRLALIGFALLAVSAVTSFSVVLLLYNPGAEAATDNPETGPQLWNVSSVQEAEGKTGYPIASPASLPAGFVQGENTIVNKLSSDHYQTHFVQQFWRLSNDTSKSLMLEQHPGLAGLVNGQPFLINGVMGERKLLPASPPNRPHPMLSLFWKDGDTSYVLTGTLVGTLTEAALLEIADSVSLPEDNPSSKVR